MQYVPIYCLSIFVARYFFALAPNLRIAILGAHRLEIEMEPKKPRGRPKGTDIPTDRRVLNALADILLREPALKPTTAIKRLVPDWTESVVHRLMGKWRKGRLALLADAQKRQEAKATRADAAGSAPVGGSMGSLAAQMRAIHESPSLRAAHEMMNSPAMKAIREIADSPAMRAMREIQDSPALRAVRDIQNSPAMQAIWQIQDSPMMKIMREQQRLRRSLGF
jgi:hypothetical protein